jgi:hypothetical protein
MKRGADPTDGISSDDDDDFGPRPVSEGGAPEQSSAAGVAGDDTAPSTVIRHKKMRKLAFEEVIEHINPIFEG